MRIVSQNKSFSVNIDMALIDQCDGVITCVVPGIPDRFLGKYKTRERAEEVFLDIHKAYVPGDMFEIPPDAYYMPAE